MAKDQIPQDQEPEFLPIQNRISQFFKKKFMVIAMFILAIILLLPTVIFVVSSLKNQSSSQNQQVAKEENLFAAPYVADELIAQLKEEYTLSELERLKRKFEKIGVVNQEKAYESDAPYLRNYYLLKFKSGTDLKKVAQELQDLREIKSLHPNFIFEANEIPNDNLYPQMWGLSKIDMPSAWNIAKGSNNVKVAVIDTGLDYNHEDFQGRNIILGYDFSRCTVFGPNGCTSPKIRDNDPMDTHGHGTHVSGTIAAVTNNSLGVAGINWNVTLVPLRALGAGRNGDSRDIIDALQYAIDQQVDIVNMSISAPFSCNDSRVADYNRTVADAVSRGIVIVAAAGNANVDARTFTPASCDGVITVGNSTSSDGRAGDSNYGTRVDIAAPGVEIYSTLPGNAYGPKSGTSMAAPHVSGVIGLLLAVNPQLSREEILSCLVNGADPIQTDDDRPIGPRLNALRTLNVCSGLPPVPPSPTSTSTPTSTDSTSTSTPIQTYTCREVSPPQQPSRDSIQIGNLICEPNP